MTPAIGVAGPGTRRAVGARRAVRAVTRLARRVGIDRVEALQRRLPMTRRARSRLRRAVGAVRAMAGSAALRRVRVHRRSFVLVTRGARGAGSERSRVRVVAAGAGGMSLRCGPRFVDVAAAARGLRHRGVRGSVARAAARVSKSRVRRLCLFAVATGAKARALLREREGVRCVARGALDPLGMERVIVSAIRMARRTRSCDGGLAVGTGGGWRRLRCAARSMGSVTSDARLLAVRRTDRRVRWLHALVTAHARPTGRSVRPVWIVTARAIGMRRSTPRPERLHGRMTGRRARCPSFGRCVG